MLYAIVWENLNGAGKFFLIFAIILIVLYLCFLLIVMFEVRKFRIRLRRKRNCLAILAVEERRLLIKTDSIFSKANDPIVKIYHNQFEELLRLSLSKMGTSALFSSLLLLKAFRKIIQRNLNDSKFDNNEEILNIRDNFSDLDYEKRRQIALYNSDVDAFNYWISLGPTSWIFFLAGRTKRSRLD